MKIEEATSGNHAKYKGRVAMITGAASGLGEAIAKRLGTEGAQLVLVDLNEQILEDLCVKLRASGISVFGIACNIAEESQVIQAVNAGEQHFGRIDILVNSAGIVGPTSTRITDFATSDFEKVCRVNLIGSFLLAKYVIPVMQKQQYGRILLISSIAGKEGNPGMVGYSASKAGVIGLVKGVAKEFATSGITVNGLAPAVIKTAMNEDTAPDQLAYMTAKIPMGRLGETDEVAAMVSFIVSEENSFSTGFIYDISGGRATY